MRATLTYHSIDDSGSPISVPPRALEEHLRWFASGRVRVLSLDELVAETDEDGDAVAVTFDDAFLNAHAPAARLLDRGLPVTLFVVPAHVGRTNAWGGRDEPGIPTLPLMGWDDLARLAEAGAEIASHTLSHARLTEVSPDRVDEELAGGLDGIASKLGVRSRHLAYPYGAVNDDVAARAAARHGWAHTTSFRALAPGDDPLRLPRLDMYYFREPGALERWGTTRFAARVAGIRARRAIRAVFDSP